MRHSVTHPPVDPVVELRARQMRSALTPSEQKLWAAIRGSRLGVCFRRQVPLGRFIADFVAPWCGSSLKWMGNIMHGGAWRMLAGTVSSVAWGFGCSAWRRCWLRGASQKRSRAFARRFGRPLRAGRLGPVIITARRTTPRERAEYEADA